MNDTVVVNVSNIEKDFRIVHDEFMRYLRYVKELAVSSQIESEEKDIKIEELVSKVNEPNDTVKQLKENNDELIKGNERLEIGYKSIFIKNNDLQEDVKHANAKYEREKSLRNIGSEANYKLKNKELEVSFAELTTKKSSLEEENKKMHNIKKEVAEKTELVTQLEKRNQLLKTELEELSTLKIRNIELEGTVKVLEAQSKLLENTLSAIVLDFSKCDKIIKNINLYNIE